MEFIIGSGIATFIMYAAAKWKPNISDRNKIEAVFRNINYKVKDREPRLFKKNVYEMYVEYIYNVPFGLVDDKKLQPILEKTLGKYVEVSFKSKLFIRVYKEILKTEYKYNLFPYKKDGWSIPIGMSQEGIVYHDFNKIPHMIVSGATTMGKTVFMKMLMTHLIENNPNGVEFYILDLKGGLAFNKYKNLKQVKAVSGNYKESASVLKAVKNKIQEDMNYFKSINAENAEEANVSVRKFILVDEAGELMPKKSMSDSDKAYTKQCQDILSHIARVSGQLAYTLIFGTQYPTAEILDNQIKANSSAKIAFKLQTSTQSGVAIDEGGAELLECPGRAIYKTTDKYIVQTPLIKNKEIWNRLRRYERNDSNQKEDPQTGENIIHFG